MKYYISRASFALALILVLAGCETIPDENRIPLRLNVSLPGGSGAAGALSALASDRLGAAGVIPQPTNDVYHLRISLTNPSETFYVYGYEPGTQISLMVTSGDNRVIDVEAWMIPGVIGPKAAWQAAGGIAPTAAPMPTSFDNQNFVTFTPVAQRTVSLNGQATTVNIELGLNPNLGTAYDDPPFPVLTEGGTFWAPLSPTCPSPSFLYATVTDQEWGISFPTIYAAMYSGSTVNSIILPNLPIGRGYTINFYHDEGGFLGSTSFHLDSSLQPLDIVFDHGDPAEITLTPEQPLNNLIPDDIIDVGLSIDKGVGSFGPFVVAGATLGGIDTCAGIISGSTYTFMVPDFVTSCDIMVAVIDCAGLINFTIEKVTILANPPPDCNDGVDNDLDGSIDYPDDPGCASAKDTSELGTTACDDGLDGDGWGEPDFFDPGCSGPADTTETDPALACDDGVSNDSWPDIDVADPGCTDPWDSAETDPAVECDDGADNDSWADIDMADSGCTGPTDSSEFSPTDQCDDGADNDGWGDFDVADPGCASAVDASELNPAVECDDGVNNDNWPDIDVADPGCANATDTAETNPVVRCDDGADNDGWADIDMADGGCTSATDSSELSPTDPCDDGADNDGWADIDVADPGCVNRSDTSEYDPAVACDDGIDSDGWGDTDPTDPGCASAVDASEYNPAVECDNGANNDSWGDIDVADPGCASATDNSELDPAVECDDMANNDSWPDVDSTDPGCSSASDTTETNAAVACDDGTDNDGWADIDLADPGCANATDGSEYDPAVVCDDGLDNESDGYLDYYDPGCATRAGTQEWRTWFVSQTGDNSTGLNWTNAYTTVQSAIAAAAIGDKVFVKQGGYTGPGGDTLVTMTAGVSLYGGFLGTESLLSERGNPFDYPTVLGGGSYTYQHIVRGASNAEFDGFAVTGGSNSDATRGAGIHAENLTNFTVNQCNIYGNYTSGGYAGVGMVIYNGVNIKVMNSWIHHNTSAGGDSGGGILTIGGGGTSTFNNCLFYANNAGSYYGGGLGVFFTNAVVENCTFADNYAASGGNAIDAQLGGTTTIINSILAGSALVSTYGGSVVVASFSDIQDGSVAGTGVFFADPLFAGGMRGNYYLSQIPLQGSNSPSFDTGSDTAVNLGMSLFTTRTNNAPDSGTVDMGYHYPP